jgi:hypothetical protein
MLVAVAAVMAVFTQLTAAIARSGFLELAEGDWLTIVAHYVYDVDRQTATFATGQLRLNNTGGGVYPMGPNDLIVSCAANGKSYRNLEAFTLGALETNKLINMIAVEVGAASRADAGTITTFVTPLLQVSCTNPSALEAQDDESDAALRTRCYEKLGALSPNGPWDAYSYVCKSAKRPDGSPIGVTRVRLVKDGYGNLTVYVATATGGVATSDVAILQDAIDKNSTTQCVNAVVVSATPVVLNFEHETWIYNTSSQTPDQLEDAIYTKLRSYVQSQPLGGNILEATTPPTGKVFADAIKSVIGAAMPSLIVHTNLITPSGDTTLQAYEVPVMGTVLTTLHQIPTPEGHSP